MTKKRLFILLQYIVPQHFLSYLMGLAANSTCKKLKNYMISRFIRRYNVDMSIAQIENPEDYPSFNAFFTRAVKNSARPVAAGNNTVVNPVDGCLSQIGTMQDDTLLQAKGVYYSLTSLLGNHPSAASFQNGSFATFYLSPRDYHRVHMPLEGKLVETIYVPGKLFSVNATATEMIPHLFSRNERLVCLFESPAGPMAVILIGAMLVGQIQTIWGLIEKSKKIVTRNYIDQEDIFLSKGAELGK
ncbi:MAG TPA: archaetidylserine decarboxylase, partial [Gammaproteobacteria bacterium]|nr:archaetidylserine decarboxylase [Gammaproteobacteria bacterium]